MFRDLKPDEIEVRVAKVTQKMCKLLLYKDARCDMNILDETVGAFGWKREHLRDNANCIVSIWDDKKNQWVSKEDTGKESFSEKEKGLASDSFKRACFNWGIGRELYTSPEIKVWNPNFTLIEPNGKQPTTYDNFKVKSISIKDHVITSLVIVNENMGNKVVFSYGVDEVVENPKKISKSEVQSLRTIFEKHEWNEKEKLNGKTIEELDSTEYGIILRKLNGDKS